MFDQPSDGTKPAIVLVHGAWADASSWNGVIVQLQAEGYTVYAPPNPLAQYGIGCRNARGIC
jgi:pimeloyl-ACP methyl ester carboxylesterase